MCEWSTMARSPIGLAGSTGSGTADRQEIERPIEVSARGQPEVRGGDRRDEARVERLGDPKRRMGAIPSGAQRQVVEAQLEGMNDAQDLDSREVRLQQLAILAQRVLAQVPRILRLLGTRRGERQPVRRRDEGKRRDSG